MFIKEEEELRRKPVALVTKSTTVPKLFPNKPDNKEPPDFIKPEVASPPPSKEPKLSKTLPSWLPSAIIFNNRPAPLEVEPLLITLPRIVGSIALIAELVAELFSPITLAA